MPSTKRKRPVIQRRRQHAKRVMVVFLQGPNDTSATVQDILDLAQSPAMRAPNFLRDFFRRYSTAFFRRNPDFIRHTLTYQMKTLRTPPTVE